jgi:hypothetical protein
MVMRMNRMRICSVFLLVLAACADDDKSPAPDAPDASVTDAGNAGSESKDSGSIDASGGDDGGCRPRGTPCVDSADALKCCSRSCSVNSSSPTGACY